MSERKSNSKSITTELKPNPGITVLIPGEVRCKVGGDTELTLGDIVSQSLGQRNLLEVEMS